MPTAKVAMNILSRIVFVRGSVTVYTSTTFFSFVFQPNFLFFRETNVLM